MGRGLTMAQTNRQTNNNFKRAQVCSDYLAQYNQKEYDKNYEAFQNFTELMRNGLPVHGGEPCLPNSLAVSRCKHGGRAKENGQQVPFVYLVVLADHDHLALHCESRNKQRHKVPRIGNYPRCCEVPQFRRVRLHVLRKSDGCGSVGKHAE